MLCASKPVMLLLLKCYSFHFMEAAYEASLAKFEYSIQYKSRGLCFCTSGFPQLMPVSDDIDLHLRLPVAHAGY